jgi:hypothetical protein
VIAVKAVFGIAMVTCGRFVGSMTLKCEADQRVQHRMFDVYTEHFELRRVPAEFVQ